MIFLLIQCCQVGVLWESMLVLIAWKIQMHFVLQKEEKCHGLTIIESFCQKIIYDEGIRDGLGRDELVKKVHHLYGQVWT